MAVCIDFLFSPSSFTMKLTYLPDNERVARRKVAASKVKKIPRAENPTLIVVSINDL